MKVREGEAESEASVGKEEGGALSPPGTPFPPWGTPYAAGVAEEHPVPTHPLFKMKLPKSRRKKCFRTKGGGSLKKRSILF